jgi:hypothetical protein
LLMLEEKNTPCMLIVSISRFLRRKLDKSRWPKGESYK